MRRLKRRRQGMNRTKNKKIRVHEKMIAVDIERLSAML